MESKRKGLARTIEDIGRFEAILQLLRDNPDELSHLRIPLVQNQIDTRKRVVECVEKDEPFIAAWYTTAPEIWTAMGIPWYCQVADAFGSAIEGPNTMSDLEGMDQLPVPADACTLLRLGLYYVDAEILPVPTAVVALLEPCDGVVSMHEAILSHKGWRNVPTFGPDPPYFEDERSVAYFAKELRRMTAFVEEHTGHKLDIARLKDVVEESNKQYELWLEHSDLQRSIPCPHGMEQAMSAFVVAQNTLCGLPEATDWFRDLVADAERRVRENRPVVPNQEIRVLWFDIHPVWFGELTPWLEEQWGALVVQSMFINCPYTLIDTSSEDAIWMGLAKRNLLDTPMIRQARGTTEGFLRDLERLVKDFKIDCVIWPGHMGHKDSAASISVMKEKCRELGVPFLHIGVDQFDRRYTPVEEIKHRISEFFNVMGLG